MRGDFATSSSSMSTFYMIHVVRASSQRVGQLPTAAERLFYATRTQCTMCQVFFKFTEEVCR